jgi:hypothetical protein
MVTETDLATAVATDPIKQVPLKEAYQDGLSPAVRRQDRPCRILLRHCAGFSALQFTAALQDRYVKFLDRSVRQIPEERRYIPRSSDCWSSS